MILGIDQSYTKTGYCIFDSTKQVIDFGILTSNRDEDKFDRAGEISTQILDICNKYPITNISIEGLAYGMTGNNTRDLAGLLFVIIVSIRSKFQNIKINIVSPKSVKLLATGSGKASKSQMIEALPENVCDLFKSSGVKKTTGLGDLADAYFIGLSTFDNL